MVIAVFQAGEYSLCLAMETVGAVAAGIIPIPSTV
jgi:hypothetical protein